MKWVIRNTDLQMFGIKFSLQNLEVVLSTSAGQWLSRHLLDISYHTVLSIVSMCESDMPEINLGD